MSYDIALVIPPLPASDEEAWGVLEFLCETTGPAPALFRQAHDQLTAKYPCICSLPDEQVDDGVWSDGPLWVNFGPRAAVLGLVYSRVEEVLPFVLETAGKLGLIVFDWQEDRVHRPDGSGQ